MKRQPWGLYAVAGAILVVGLIWAGVPAGTLLFAGLFLACPLMMMTMMRGMHGGDMSGHDGHDAPTQHQHQGHQQEYEEHQQPDGTDDRAGRRPGAGRR